MQNTAYDMRISDWSSDVCSSDLLLPHLKAGNCALGEQPRDIRLQRDALQQIERDYRQHDVELKVSSLRRNGDRCVIADHLRGNLRGCLRDYRIDLARHDR